jgi:hypothetical protein
MPHANHCPACGQPLPLSQPGAGIPACPSCRAAITAQPSAPTAPDTRIQQETPPSSQPVLCPRCGRAPTCPSLFCPHCEEPLVHRITVLGKWPSSLRGVARGFLAAVGFVSLVFGSLALGKGFGGSVIDQALATGGLVLLLMALALAFLCIITSHHHLPDFFNRSIFGDVMVTLGLLMVVALAVIVFFGAACTVGMFR